MGSIMKRYRFWYSEKQKALIQEINQKAIDHPTVMPDGTVVPPMVHEIPVARLDDGSFHYFTEGMSICPEHDGMKCEWEDAVYLGEGVLLKDWSREFWDAEWLKKGVKRIPEQIVTVEGEAWGK